MRCQTPPSVKVSVAPASQQLVHPDEVTRCQTPPSVKVVLCASFAQSSTPGPRSTAGDYDRWHGLRDARDPRGPGARSGDRRGDDADLPDLDVRAGGGGRPQGLRLRPRREPDAHRARGVPGLARGRGLRPRVLVRARRDDDDHASRRSRRARRVRERRLRRHLPDVLAGVRAEGLPASPTSRPTRSRHEPRRAPRRAHARSCGSRRRRTRCSTSSTSAPSPRPRTPQARSSSSTTRSRRRICSSRSSSAPTSSCTRRRSTSAATPTSIGGFAAHERRRRSAERLRFLQKSLGAVPGPFDSWLVLRGVKTLAVRMRQHCENARAVVAFLQEHPRVERVLYPGLPDHPGHDDRRAPDARLRRHGLVPARVGGGGRRAGRAHEASGRWPRASAASRA